MSLKELLKNKIFAEGQASRDSLRVYGRQNNFDIDTVGRKLRELTEEKIIQPIFKGNYIIGYNRINSDELGDLSDKFGQKQPPASVSGQNTNNMPDKLNWFNNRLRAILDNIKPSWSNADEIKKLANALKSNNKWTKISVLRGYEKKI